MTLFLLGWHWLTHWIFGWGGIGGAISVAAWALWYFTPSFLQDNKNVLLHIAVAATVATLTSTYLSASEYKRGVRETIASYAAEDAKRIARDEEGVRLIRECRARQGVWDVVTGSCQ